jgi:hypothetical protein
LNSACNGVHASTRRERHDDFDGCTNGSGGLRKA